MLDPYASTQKYTLVHTCYITCCTPNVLLEIGTRLRRSPFLCRGPVSCPRTPARTRRGDVPPTEYLRASRPRAGPQHPPAAALRLALPPLRNTPGGRPFASGPRPTRRHPEIRARIAQDQSEPMPAYEDTPKNAKKRQKRFSHDSRQTGRGVRGRGRAPMTGLHRDAASHNRAIMQRAAARPRRLT